MSLQCFFTFYSAMECAVEAHKVLWNAAIWVQRQFKPSLRNRSQMLSKVRKEKGASQRSATSLHTLPACFLQQQTLFLSVSCMLILTHTGGFDCAQQNPAAQQAPSPDSPSCPPPRPSGMGCLASLHLPQSESLAAACRWAQLSVDQALWPPPPSVS